MKPNSGVWLAIAFSFLFVGCETNHQFENGVIPESVVAQVEPLLGEYAGTMGYRRGFSRTEWPARLILSLEGLRLKMEGDAHWIQDQGCEVRIGDLKSAWIAESGIHQVRFRAEMNRCPRNESGGTQYVLVTPEDEGRSFRVSIYRNNNKSPVYRGTFQKLTP